MKKHSLFPVCLLIITFISCSSPRYIYTASPANNPIFVEKGESKLTAYYSENGKREYSSSDGNDYATKKANGFDFQGAFALTKNFAITAGYYNRREKDIAQSGLENSTIQYKRGLFDLGGGFFLPLNKKQTITFNIYGGVSAGKFSFTDQAFGTLDDHSQFHNSHVFQWYYQPAFNFMPGKGEYFRMAVLFKKSFVYYSNIKTSYAETEIKQYNLDKLDNKYAFRFPDVEMNFLFGLPEYPWIKLDAAFVFIFPGVNKKINNVRGQNSSIGLTFDLSKTSKRNSFSK